MHLSLLPRHRPAWPLAIKIIILIFPLAAGWTLLNDHFFLTSTIASTYHPGDAAHIIRPADPGTLVRSSDPTMRWRLTTDTFPFSVLTPFAAETVRVRTTVTVGSQEFVALTASGNDHLGDLTSIGYSSVLNNLVWNHVSDGGLTLWQRSNETGDQAVTAKQYSSVASFLAAPIAGRTVAQVGLDRMASSTIADYTPNTSSITLRQSFRGSHQVYVYVGNETLHMEFDAVALNRTKGKNNLVVRVGRADQFRSDNHAWLLIQRIGDDGITDGQGTIGPEQHISLDLPVTRPGYFLVDIVTSDDTLIQHVTSRQHTLAFNGHVYMADGPAYQPRSDDVGATIYSNGQRLSLSANHDEGLQTATVNGKDRKLTDVRVPTTIKGFHDVVKTVLSTDDVVVESDGLVTVAPATLPPDAGMVPLDVTAPVDLEGIDYIVANYRIPSDAHTITLDHSFPASDLAMSQDNQYHMALSAPGVSSGGTIAIRSIHVNLIRGAYPWSTLWEKVRHALKKL